MQAAAARETRGTPTAGAIPNGARIEREIGYDFNDRDSLTLALRDPDFTTAARIEDVINSAYGAPVAYTRDPGTIDLDLRGIDGSPSRILADIENLPVSVSVPARIVIDEKSGTIVLGEDVTISKVAIAQGNISIKVVESPVVSQPNPFARGESIALPRSRITIGQTDLGAQRSRRDPAGNCRHHSHHEGCRRPARGPDHPLERTDSFQIVVGMAWSLFVFFRLSDLDGTLALERHQRHQKLALDFLGFLRRDLRHIFQLKSILVCQA